jgi:hypothetical protein
MRWLEIITNTGDLLAETKPTGGDGPVEPLTPAKATAARKRAAVNQTRVADVKAANALRLGIAQRKAAEK